MFFSFGPAGFCDRRCIVVWFLVRFLDMIFVLLFLYLLGARFLGVCVLRFFFFFCMVLGGFFFCVWGKFCSSLVISAGLFIAVS